MRKLDLRWWGWNCWKLFVAMGARWLQFSIKEPACALFFSLQWNESKTGPSNCTYRALSITRIKTICTSVTALPDHTPRKFIGPLATLRDPPLASGMSS